ncbi:SCP2 sterol-binding domain-containing protein [Dactylosporangium sp. NPDC051541]|uniref:SCP2 sterol-binding domain-containing protein n=1 Tax=Dactylosporangium sp. NPDC051541 TaxID=3363977 RepID=UPI0037B9742F
MSELDALGDFNNIDPKQFAAYVKSASDSQLAEIMSSPQRKTILDTIFSRFPELFRADRAGSTNAIIHWNITGAPDGGADSYELVIANGACTLSPSPDQEPKLAITVGPVDFLKVVSGVGNPMMMFMTGKLKAKGDLGLAANIANLFDIPKA